MAKMRDGEAGEARDFGGRNREERDKGMAPSLRYQSEPMDGENINVPNDAMGEPIAIFKAGNNLTAGGDANYPGKFKPVVGRANLLKDEPGFNREGGKPGVE